MDHRTIASRLRRMGLSALLLTAPAFAGPPLLCDPFDTAGAPSLPWGGDRWNQPVAGYDRTRLVEGTQALLTPQAPVVARMETLRRAAMYASRDGGIARALARALDARVATAGDDDARALALFDAGYLRETFEDVVRLQGYDMPGFGEVDAAALRVLLDGREGSEEIARALALRPGDAAMHFAAALVARADGRRHDAVRHARLARAGSDGDRLPAGNMALLAN